MTDGAVQMRAARHVIERPVLRRLAQRRGEPVLTTVYLDVDGARRPVAADFERAFERLADELRRRARARQDAASAVSAVEADLAAMRERLARGVDRARTRGLAMFSCQAQGWFEAIELPTPLRDQGAIGAAPRIRQLVEAADEPEPLLVALVDSAHLRLLRVAAHAVEEPPATVTPPERSVDTTIELGSFEDRDAEAARKHYRLAAAAVQDAVRDWPVRQIVVGGPDEAVAELQRRLHPTAADLVVGRLGARVGAPAAEIVPRARALAQAAERAREAAVVEEARQRAAAGKGAVVGLQPTLAVLAEQAAATLLVAQGFSAPGGLCPACGRIGPDLRQCPVCGATNEELEDVVEVAIERAVAQGADVEFCTGTELERFGSIAAIERY